MAQRTIERVGRAEIQLSHLDKPFFPADGISKGDLVGYYREMAPLITGYLRHRPLVMGRYPDGITGQGIVQKNAPRHFPGWVTVTDVPKRDGTVRHVVGDKPETLVYLANQGCVELHAFLSRRDALDTPDQLVFDLDPPDEAGFGQAREHALALRELLAGELGLGSYVKTTGGKGLHVHVMLRPAGDFDSVRGFAREIAALLASRHPGELTVEQRKDQRGRRLYLDVMRNAYAQTAIAPSPARIWGSGGARSGGCRSWHPKFSARMFIMLLSNVLCVVTWIASLPLATPRRARPRFAVRAGCWVPGFPSWARCSR